MPRRGYRATSQDVVINAALGVAISGVTTANVSGDLPLWVAGPVVAACGYELLRRNIRPARRSLASDAPKLIVDKAGQQWLTFRDRKAAPMEFTFEAPGLPVAVTSTDLERFCGIAKRRTNLARYGAGVKSKDILSKGYFTRRITNPFLVEEYEAIRLVLEVTRYWKGRSPGRSGRLVGIEHVTAADYVAGVERTWLALLAQWQKGRAWGRITNLLPSGGS